MTTIVEVFARSILDSRGNPTVEVDVVTEKGIFSFPHYPNFNVDENCIEMGVEIFSILLFEYMRNENSK